MLLTLLANFAMLPARPDAIELRRQFEAGERAQYHVHSTLNGEVRGAGLETWLPDDYDIDYKFNYSVTAIKADGICQMRYLRPTMTEIEGETPDSPPKTKVTKVGFDLDLTVSPINEILSFKDLAPKKPPKSGGLRTMKNFGDSMPQGFIDQFTEEIYTLALFAGGLDSSLDFSPPLPLLEVSPGDTWKKTVGFSPQRLQGKGNKQAVQRLDFTYKYAGIADSNGKKVHRIEGSLGLKTDLAEFVHQTFEVKPERTGLKEIPMWMDSKIMFELDLKTMTTLTASAESTGGYRIVLLANPNVAALEEKFKARSTLNLLGLKRGKP